MATLASPATSADNKTEIDIVMLKAIIKSLHDINICIFHIKPLSKPGIKGTYKNNNNLKFVELLSMLLQSVIIKLTWNGTLFPNAINHLPTFSELLCAQTVLITALLSLKRMTLSFNIL